MTKAQIAELILLDERFLDWATDPDAKGDLASALEKGQRFLLIQQTCDGEVDIKSFDTLDELKAEIQDDYENPEPGSGWEIEALFDLAEKKELLFNVKVEVIISE